MNSLLGKTDNKSFDVIDNIVSGLLNFLIIVISILALMYVLFIPFNIDGSSMLPSLNNGDMALVSKLTQPNKSDIVVVDTGKDYKKDGQSFKHYIIKRVVASENEKVAFLKEDGVINLYIDSGSGFKKVEEDYINEKMELSSSSLFTAVDICSTKEEMSQKNITVPENSVFVLGDNRNVSLDSRRYGCFEITSIVGTVIANFNQEDFWFGFFSLFYKSENTTNNI